MMHPISARLIEYWRTTRMAEGVVPLHAPRFEGNEWAFVKECIDTGWVSSVGSYVDRFEAMLASITGAGFAIATVNGTSALQLALHLAGVGPGDRVVVPALSFVATANAVSHCGATCAFVDIEAGRLGLDPARLDAFLAVPHQPAVKAVVAMHCFGHPCDLDGLAAVCAKHGVVLIEDAAESLGSYYRGRHTGTIGRLGILSFNGNKIVTTGGGGAILTNDADLAARAKHLSTTAKVPHPFRFDHDDVAWNFRLPNLNAALGCAQLELLPEFLVRKRRLADDYAALFADLDGVRVLREPEGCVSNYWLNAVLLDTPDLGVRDRVIEEVAAAGLQCRPAWTPLHHLPMYRDCRRDDLFVTETMSARVINLPSSAVAG
jgi:perosamine synthetase